jgi:sugar phosphate isomerase/epimerase
MEALASLGGKYVVIPALVYPEERAGVDDYKKLADEFSSHGEKMSKYGLQFVYHNHGYEHATKDGQTPMDILLTRCDAKYVKFELDIFWMTAAGASPVEYLKNYPGKFKLMHIKDAKEPIRFAGDGGTPEQWMELFPKMSDPGTGVLEIKAIVDQARVSGVEHFFLERDLAPDPMTTLKNSFKFLSGI